VLLWATRAGGTSEDRAIGITSDGVGGSIVTGWFAGTSTFGAGEPNETVLTEAGGNDIFLARYDADGALLWAARAGGPSENRPGGISSDGAGGSIVIGWFAGTSTFGAGEPNETVLTEAGGNDIFLARYDADGALLWATRGGGQNAEFGFGVTKDSAGGILITGVFSGQATFGAGEQKETTLTGTGGYEILLARYGDVNIDADGDDVPDDADQCPATPENEAVDASGCAINQLCLCDGNWKNHGQYVSCVANASEEFLAAGLISQSDKDATISAAAGSSCGEKKR
jgi:hypothetical protein